MLAKDADTTALNRITQDLTETKSTIELLRARGYGQHGMSILDTVKPLPAKPAD